MRFDIGFHAFVHLSGDACARLVYIPAGTTVDPSGEVMEVGPHHGPIDSSLVRCREQAMLVKVGEVLV